MVEYPKWIELEGGFKCIVPDAQTEAAVRAGKVAVPTPPISAQREHPPIVPTIGHVPKGQAQ